MENITIIAHMLSEEIQQELITGYTLTDIEQASTPLGPRNRATSHCYGGQFGKSSPILSGKYLVSAVVKRFPMFVGDQPS